MRYELARPAFIDGYVAESGVPLGDDAIDGLIALRIAALARWLDDLSTAPTGIRTASAAWHVVLPEFVRAHGSASN